MINVRSQNKSKSFERIKKIFSYTSNNAFVYQRFAGQPRFWLKQNANKSWKERRDETKVERGQDKKNRMKQRREENRKHERNGKREGRPIANIKQQQNDKKTENTVSGPISCRLTKNISRTSATWTDDLICNASINESMHAWCVLLCSGNHVHVGPPQNPTYPSVLYTPIK